MQDYQAKPSLKEGEIQRLTLNSEEYQKEVQLMQDTQLLLTNLAEREKATVRAILDSLYEVGSVRLINKTVSIHMLRGPLKGIAQFSKPVFKLFAWRWFKRNCPELITTWLYKQVRFDDQSLLPGSETNESVPIEVLPNSELPPAAPTHERASLSIAPIIEQQAAEILALKSRITVLSVAVLILVAVICIRLVV